MKWLDDRKVETLTVTISGEGKPADVASVMLRHKRFGDLATNSGLEFVNATGASITLRGRRKNIRRFEQAFYLLNAAGAV